MSDKRLNNQCVLCGAHFIESALDGEIYCPNCGQLNGAYWEDVDDWHDDDEPDLYIEESIPCGCTLCYCSNSTEAGETCGECLSGMHQG